MKVAALQMTSRADVAPNLATAARLIEQAARDGVKLALLPENFAFMGRSEKDKRAIRRPMATGPSRPSSRRRRAPAGSR